MDKSEDPGFQIPSLRAVKKIYRILEKGRYGPWVVPRFPLGNPLVGDCFSLFRHWCLQPFYGEIILDSPVGGCFSGLAIAALVGANRVVLIMNMMHSSLRIPILTSIV